MPAQQLNFLPKVPTSHTMAQNVSASSYCVGVGLHILSTYFATWLCMESDRVNGSVVTMSLLCIF